jgi:hypothetical protein
MLLTLKQSAKRDCFTTSPLARFSSGYFSLSPVKSAVFPAVLQKLLHVSEFSISGLARSPWED